MLRVSAEDLPDGATARFDLLFAGYAETGSAPFRVASTVSLIRDADVKAIVDPGFLPDRQILLDRLQQAGEAPENITDVIFSHHHPDHTVNAALFPHAQLHDFWAIYRDDSWQSRPAEGFALAPSIRLLETPGHTPQDITTIVRTTDDVVALTHLWWTAEGPDEDPFATDMPALRSGRQRVLDVATLIVPGHGPAFRP